MFISDFFCAATAKYAAVGSLHKGNTDSIVASQRPRLLELACPCFRCCTTLRNGATHSDRIFRARAPAPCTPHKPLAVVTPLGFAGPVAAVLGGGASERAAERGNPAAGGFVHQGSAECGGGDDPDAQVAAMGSARRGHEGSDQGWHATGVLILL